MSGPFFWNERIQVRKSLQTEVVSWTKKGGQRTPIRAVPGFRK